MASHSKADVLATISREGVVPVFHNADIEATEADQGPRRQWHWDGLEQKIADTVVANGVHVVP